MRLVHRSLAIVILVAALFLGLTGTALHLIDLRAFLADAPATDLAMQSIRAGSYGEENYFQVITPKDFTAEALPKGLDYAAATSRALAAFHRQRPGVAPRLFELRMAAGRPIAQARLNGGVFDVSAVDALTGAPAQPVGIATGKAPGSLRMTIKRWHRFFVKPEFPGVYLEFLFGLGICATIITGVVTYVRLRRARAAMKGASLFWFEGPRWQVLHRTVAIVAAPMLLVTAFSGTWIGFDSVVHMWRNVPQAGDVSRPMSDAEILRMTGSTLAIMREKEPGTAIRILRLRYHGPYPQGVVVTGENEARQLVWDTRTGRALTLTEPGYPANGFPFGLQWHEYIKYFHSFYLFGRWWQLLPLASGLALIWLSITGGLMLFDTWRPRRAVGGPLPARSGGDA